MFGKGYSVLPVFKQRLDAKTLITTPNCDVMYALGSRLLQGSEAIGRSRAGDGADANLPAGKRGAAIGIMKEMLALAS